MQVERKECPGCEGKGFTLVNDGDEHYDEVSCITCNGWGYVDEVEPSSVPVIAYLVLGDLAFGASYK